MLQTLFIPFWLFNFQQASLRQKVITVPHFPFMFDNTFVNYNSKACITCGTEHV